MNFSPRPFTGRGLFYASSLSSRACSSFTSRHKWNPSQTAWCTYTASGISTRPSRS